MGDASVAGSGGGETGVGKRKLCDISGMDQTLYPTIEIDFMQLSEKCSHETSYLSNDIAWNQTFFQNES